MAKVDRVERCSGDLESERAIKEYPRFCFGKPGTLACYVLGALECSFV